MKLNRKRKHCSHCGKRMVKNGFTGGGTQRWKCPSCGSTEVRMRKDISEKKRIRILKEWLLGFQSLTEVATRYGVTRQALSKTFSQMESIRVEKEKLTHLPDELVLIADATHISHDEVVLIVYEYLSQQVIAWSFQKRESYEAWVSLFVLLRKQYLVKAIVSDGQKGLQKSIFQA